MMGRNYMHGVQRARARRGSLQSSAGFTIVETMIVLAVTGLLFVSVATMLAGRQRQTEFGQAIENVQSQLQQIVTEVANSYYPNGGDFTCSNGSVSQAAHGLGSAQGGSTNCIFVGKVIHFDAAKGQFYVYPVIGRQYTGTQFNGSNIIADFAASQPTLLADDTGTYYKGELATYQLQYGLTIHSITYSDSIRSKSGVHIGSFGLVNLGNSPSSLPSGSDQVNLLPIDDGNRSSISNPSGTEIDDINQFLGNTGPLDAMLNPDGGVQLCFASGGTNQSGLITIGGSSRVQNVSLQIKDGLSC